jgi:hypothetical protein
MTVFADNLMLSLPIFRWLPLVPSLVPLPDMCARVRVLGSSVHRRANCQFSTKQLRDFQVREQDYYHFEAMHCEAIMKIMVAGGTISDGFYASKISSMWRGELRSRVFQCVNRYN